MDGFFGWDSLGASLAPQSGSITNNKEILRWRGQRPSSLVVAVPLDVNSVTVVQNQRCEGTSRAIARVCRPIKEESFSTL